MRLHVEAAMRQDAAERLERITDDRAARVGGEDFKSHVAALQRLAGIERVKVAPVRDPGRVPLAEQARLRKAAANG